MTTHITTAHTGKLITPTGFQGYDICLNPYVGCQHSCAYCYVRFFIKDKKHKWGDFIRTRDHIKKKLQIELPKYPGMRLVMGTMTDPYQPIEETYHLTKECLRILQTGSLTKVGIFTKSTRVLNDIDLLKALPDPTVHLTIGPYDQTIIKLIEIGTPSLAERWEAVKQLKDAGIKICVNIAPALPIYSEACVPEYVKKLTEINVRQFFVDSMQMYAESAIQIAKILQNTKEWEQTRKIVLNKDKYQEWKDNYRKLWENELQKHQYDLLPIWCDHITKTWVNMKTGENIDPISYQI